jgi:endonuclease-3
MKTAGKTRPKKAKRRPAARKLREPLDARRRRAAEICKMLHAEYADADCALKHASALELLVSTILSAQCTDERVNMTTPALFAKYPDFEAMAAAKQADVETLIKSTGFFRNKATNIIAMAKAVVEQHGGELPTDLAAMVKLPGVGRKTANVVLGTWYGIPTGVVVDTHVKRITNLLGLVDSGNAEIIERELMEILPKKEWIDFGHRLIHHGRRICIARRPKCTECPLLRDCDRVGLPPLET